MRPVDPKVYGLIVLDKNIPHGAHRMWSYLAFRSGKKGYCWPGIRDIRNQMGCGGTMVKRWTELLMKHGYLKVLRDGQRLYYFPFENHKPTENSKNNRTHIRVRLEYEKLKNRTQATGTDRTRMQVRTVPTCEYRTNETNTLKELTTIAPRSGNGQSAPVESFSEEGRKAFKGLIDYGKSL